MAPHTRQRIGIAALTIVMLLVALVACVAINGIGYLNAVIGGRVAEHYQFPVNDAQWAEVIVEAFEADITIRGGADELAELELAHTFPDDVPDVTYEITMTERQGLLHIRQPLPQDRGLLLGERVFEWDIRLGDAIPITLAIPFVEADIDADLHAVPVANIYIAGQSGDVRVILPADAYIEARVSTRSGRVDVSGLERDGDSYRRTPITDTEPQNIYIDITIERGDITLRAGE